MSNLADDSATPHSVAHGAVPDSAPGAVPDSTHGAVHDTTHIAPPHFVRNNLTWLGYLLYGFWSYLWAAFGAFIPFLRSEFGIDYSVAALHFSALAVGPVIAGFCGDKIIRRLGLTRTVATGITIMLCGLSLVVLIPQVVGTISGALLIGFGGSIMSQSLTASMSERFGSERAIGILEIQTIGTLFTLLAPVAISVFVKFGLNWRAALVASVAFLAVVAVTNGKSLKAFGTLMSSAHSGAVKRPLPAPYWVLFGIIFLSVASEWAVAFWSPEFLARELHLSKSDAALGMSVFVLAMLIGRVAGRGLLRMLPVSRLLSISATVAALGFLLFWTARNLPLNLLGLFIMGLGESNVYPNCLAQALSAARPMAERAAARMALSTGGATLLAPQLLGILADTTGIGQAYGLIAVFLVVAAITVSVWRVEESV